MKKNRDCEIFHFILADDGTFPNNPEFSVLCYKNVLITEEGDRNMAVKIKRCFRENNWKNSWTNGIYDYHHYHSITHEVLGISSGFATVQLGGPDGISLHLTKGDVLVIPAGVSHKNLDAHKDFQCVGAYPNGSDYDMNYGKEGERPAADENIRKVKLPEKDPVFGIDGPLKEYWK